MAAIIIIGIVCMGICMGICTGTGMIKVGADEDDDEGVEVALVLGALAAGTPDDAADAAAIVTDA